MRKYIIVLCVLIFFCSSCRIDEPVVDNRVMVLLPSAEDMYRWDNDAKYITSALQELDIEVITKFADDTEGGDTQLQQLTEGIESGIKNFIITPVDYKVINESGILDKHDDLNIVCHDRMIYDNSGVDFFSTCDSKLIGKMQAQFIVTIMRASGKNPATFEIVAGPASDNNSKLLFEGAMNFLHGFMEDGYLTSPSGKVTFADASLPSWDTEDARVDFISRLETYYQDGSLPDFVIAGADCISVGCVEAIGNLYPDRELYPVIVGQDAMSSTLLLMDSGKISMTVDKSIREMAFNTANAIYSMMNGTVPLTDKTFDNGVKNVPVINSTPTMVISSNTSGVIYFAS